MHAPQKEPTEESRRESLLRLLSPVLVILFLKLVGGLLLYFWLNIGNTDSYWMRAGSGGEGQNEILQLWSSQESRWLYLFLGWDSSWYLSISAKGYAFSTQSYAFFPALPLFTWLLNSLFQNPLLAIVFVSISTGIAWIPLYQLAIEEYVGKSNAPLATLLYATSPYVFLFTTVAYSESFFLLATIGAWYSFKKKKTPLAIAFASLAIVSRPTGIVILLPMLAEISQTHRHTGAPLRLQDFLYLAVPLATFFSWLLYCRIMINDWIAPFDRSAWDDWVALFGILFKIIPKGELSTLLGSLRMSFTVYQLPCALFLPLSALLIRQLARADRKLAIYSTAYFIGIVAFGSLASLPRFASFLYPMWIPAVKKLGRSRNPVPVTVLICISFFLSSLLLWSGFLNGQFIA